MLVTKPLASIHDFGLRSAELLHQTFMNNAGLQIFAETKNSQELTQKLVHASQNLTDGAIFNDARVEEKPYNPFSYQQLKFRKEYGLLIQHGNQKPSISYFHYDLILPYTLLANSNVQEITTTILGHMLRQQSVLYKSPGAPAL